MARHQMPHSQLHLAINYALQYVGCCYHPSRTRLSPYVLFFNKRYCFCQYHFISLKRRDMRVKPKKYTLQGKIGEGRTFKIQFKSDIASSGINLLLCLSGMNFKMGKAG